MLNLARHLLAYLIEASLKGAIQYIINNNFLFYFSSVSYLTPSPIVGGCLDSPQINYRKAIWDVIVMCKIYFGTIILIFSLRMVTKVYNFFNTLWAPFYLQHEAPRSVMPPRIWHPSWRCSQRSCQVWHPLDTSLNLKNSNSCNKVIYCLYPSILLY